MKKAILIILLIFAMLILPGCRFGYNDTISDNRTCDGNGALNTVYDSEEEFLIWLESQDFFDWKYQSLFATDKVRFKPKKIPEGYELHYISVYRYMVTYIYKKVDDDEVRISFEYEIMHYFDTDEKKRFKTYEQTIHNYYDEIKEIDTRIYYVKYPRIQNDDLKSGLIFLNIDNYSCTIYTDGIESYDDSFFEYCEFEKVPLK